MDEQRDGPGWALPDDGPEDTVSFSAEHTERISRQPPPPPGWAPPPAGWAPPSPPGPGPGMVGGDGGWQPPPPPRRRVGLVLGIVLAVVVLVAGLGVGAVVLVRVVEGAVALEEPTPVEPAPDQARPAPGDVDPGDVDPGDLDAQAEAVLQTINASEERMLAFQEVVFGGLDDQGRVGDAAAEIAQEAQRTGDDLTELRSELRSLAGGDAAGFDGLRDIRDTYATHVDAWIAYADAVAGSPALAAPDSTEAESFWREIELSGDDFVGAMESGLPEGLPSALQDLARLIVERGFGGFDAGPPGEVV